MNRVTIRQAADVVAAACLQLRPGEDLVVLRDEICGANVAEAIAMAGQYLGSSVTEIAVTPIEYLPMREFGLFAKASLQSPTCALPRPAIQALGESDAAALVTSDFSLVFDDDFRALVADESARFVWLPYMNEERFVRLVPRTQAEASQLAENTDRIGQLVRAGGSVRVTSTQGTDLQFDLDIYRTNVSTGIPGIGDGYQGLEILPGGQVARVPDPGSANGRLVIDGSVNAPEYEQVDSPITLEVRDGIVTSVGGGLVADKLRRFLEEVDRDGEAYKLTEFGIGTNPRCRQTAQAGPAEDTHRLGCISFALGADVHLGGETRATCHVDMTMRESSVDLAGHTIVRRGLPAWSTGTTALEI